MATLKQRLEQAGAKLAEAKRNVELAQKEFDELFRQATGARSGKKQTDPSEKGSEVVDDTSSRLVDRVAAVLFETPLREHRYQDIAEKLCTTPATVRAMLNKLRAEGRAHRTGPAVWKANQKPTGSDENKGPSAMRTA
jgi:hypothetical protein